jgi:hypothetical protein
MRIPYQEYAKTVAGAAPVKGTLQVMAQQLHLTWCSIEDHGARTFPCKNYDEIFFMPVFMPTNTASHIAEALEQGWPRHFSLAELESWLPHIRLLVLGLHGDLDAANTRVKNWYLGELRSMNCRAVLSGTGGAAVLLDVPCLAHVLNVISSKAFGKHTFVPRLHALSFTFNNPSHFEHVLRALKVIIEHDIAVGVGFFSGQHPPDECSAHSQNVIDATMLRHRHTRGRSRNGLGCG